MQQPQNHLSTQTKTLSQNLVIFLNEISNYSYSEKYHHWIEFLDKTESQSSSNNKSQHLQALQLFLQYYPFNYQYWISYIEKTNNFQLYEKLALKRNCKSFQLWSNYLLGIKATNIKQTNQQKYKKDIQKAIIEVGADTRSLSFYEEYFTMLSQNFRYEFYKKVMMRSLIGLEDVYQRFEKWIKVEADEGLVNSIYTKQMKGMYSLTEEISVQQKRQYLYEQIEKQYKKTIRHRAKRLEIQEKIKFFYFNGTEAQVQEKQLWRQLINLERSQGTVQNISYCYERCLMSQTEDLELWNEMFYYLEHQANKYSKVLSILRNNKTFFLNFSSSNCQIYLYWTDLEERENTARTREMYQQLLNYHSPSSSSSSMTSTSNRLQKNSKMLLMIYQRCIQFEIREKQYNTAKQHYDKMLEIFALDYEVLSYILIEYSKFVLKYYKDYTYPKKLLQNYFEYEHMPYNTYLMTGYLEFIEHSKNNDGYYDELMKVLTQAVKKAKKTLKEDEFNTELKMIKYYLRSALGSIYLIKMSESKLMEIAASMDSNNGSGEVNNDHNNGADDHQSMVLESA